jgi:hypothetical protein
MKYRSTLHGMIRPNSTPSERWWRDCSGELRRKHRGWMDVLAEAEPARDRRSVEAEALALAVEDVRGSLAREGLTADGTASGGSGLTVC